MNTAYPVVERAELAPACCLFTKSHNGPFIDLLRDFDFDHAGRMYISCEFARQLGVLAGSPSRERFTETFQALQEVTKERDELLDEVESLREFERAARYTVETLGDRIRRKPGPKKREPQAA